MTLYIHIGNYKTGSTSIQSFVFRNRKRFKELGYLVPETGSSGAAHHDFARVLNRNDDETASLLARMKSELAASSQPHAIITTENLFNGRSAQQIADALGADDVKVVSYLRRQDEFASAFYMQFVKHPNFMWSTKPDLALFTDKEGASNYLASLKRWAAAFGEDSILTHPFEKNQLPDGLLKHFLGTIGIDPAQFGDTIEEPRVNITIESELIEYLRLANGTGISPEEHGRLLSALERISERANGKALFTKRNMFSPEDRRTIIVANAADNAEIARRYLGRTDGVLFHDPLPNDDDTWTPIELTVETLAQISAGLWVEQQSRLRGVISRTDRTYVDRLVHYLFGRFNDERSKAATYRAELLALKGNDDQRA